MRKLSVVLVNILVLAAFAGTGTAAPFLPVEQAKLLAGDGSTQDRFGVSVSVDGDTALIGSYLDDDKGANSGSAYVFVRSGSTWTEQAKLVPPFGAVEGFFGGSVSLSGDTALIGSYGDDAKGWDSGSVYVFVRSGSTWTAQAKLVPADGAAGDRFGGSVSLRGDTALIGTHRDDDLGVDSGSAYVFVRSGSSWTQQAKLLPLVGARGDQFGYSVSLSGDTALIGSPGDDDKGPDSGSAYVYERIGVAWIQQAKLVPAYAAAADEFGLSVSVDGDTALIGSPGDSHYGPASGSAYVYERIGSTWIEGGVKLVPSDGAAYDNWGYAVSVHGDIALVGHPSDAAYTGSAYVFARNGSTWPQQAKLLASDAAAYDFFGISVSLDGDTALIGSPGDDDKGHGSGSAYVYMVTDDRDGDGLSNDDEVNTHGTDPSNRDTDGDFYGDGTEVVCGSNPTDPLSFPTCRLPDELRL